MGDPKKQRRKYSSPMHPWQGWRIEEERELLNAYGLKNKKEIWKSRSLLKNFKNQAKSKTTKPLKQIQKEQKLLLEKLAKLKLLPANSKVEDILGLTVKDILERRLQTLVYRQNLARTVKQARQFIIHGHMMVNGIKNNIPSYLVNSEEEGKISFLPHSQLSDKNHPERIVKVENTKIIAPEVKKEDGKANQKKEIVNKKPKKLTGKKFIEKKGAGFKKGADFKKKNKEGSKK